MLPEHLAIGKGEGACKWEKRKRLFVEVPVWSGIAPSGEEEMRK